MTKIHLGTEKNRDKTTYTPIIYNVHQIKYAIMQFLLRSLKKKKNPCNIKCYQQPRGVLFMLSNVLHLKYFILPIILVDFGGVSLPGR